MNELKTLKDIDGDKFIWYEKGVPIRDREITETDLRKEAINWFKTIQSFDNPIQRHKIPEFILAEIPKDILEDKPYIKECNPGDIFQLGMEYGALMFILNFFNIAQEDLK